jgi:hypothetical protein
MLDGCLRWLRVNVARFDLAAPSGDESRSFHLKRQPFGELAIACMLLARHDALRRRPEYHILINHVITTARTAGFPAGGMRARGLFNFVTAVHAALGHLGIELPEFRTRIERMLESGVLTSLDQPASARMELKYFLDLGGIANEVPSYAALVPATLAATQPLLPYVRVDDAYEMTHTFFYLTDFGARPLSAFVAQIDETREYLALLSGSFAHARAWDVAGELIACCSYLGARSHPLVEQSRQRLTDAQTVAGFVPGPSYDPSSDQLQEPERASDYIFSTCYHSTLVAVIVACSFL